MIFFATQRCISVWLEPTLRVVGWHELRGARIVLDHLGEPPSTTSRLLFTGVVNLALQPERKRPQLAMQARTCRGGCKKGVEHLEGE